jgi:hypothetical protein
LDSAADRSSSRSPSTLVLLVTILSICHRDDKSLMITGMPVSSCECPGLKSEPTNSILATRTLTTLISTFESAPTIRPTSRFEYSHGTQTTGNDREGGPQELRIPNAFATLLSRDGENVTVASRVTVQNQSNDVNVDLVVCFDGNPPELAMARGSRNSKADETFLPVADSALRPEKPYSLRVIESDHAGIDVSKSPHAFVKECL